MRHFTRTCLTLLFLLSFAAPILGDPPDPTPPVKPAFEQLVVRFEPFGLGSFSQVEELRIEAKGRCWYKVEGREAKTNLPGRSGAVFHHDPSPERIRRLNQLLEGTQWLAAEGAEGPARHTHPTNVTITVHRKGQQRTVLCQGERPEPYNSLLRELYGLALQERHVYLHDYVGGDAGSEAWAEIGRDLAALHGGPFGEPVFKIEYERYLPIARRTLRPFHSQEESELIPAIRIIGHFKVESELPFLHQMAHHPSSNVRTEVAWALGRLHHEESLPILAEMMAAPANREAAGRQLVVWGEEAVPHIARIIEASTDESREHWEHTKGEDMIRAYLDHWQKAGQPIDPRVIAAVREALKKSDPTNSVIRTTYHKEFLQRIEAMTDQKK